MQTLTLKTRVGRDGMVKLEIPTDLADRDVEIVLVMHPLNSETADAMGYPLGYFEETYGIFADQPLERGEQPLPEVRDTLE